MHDDEITVSADQVRELLHTQCPALADAPIRRITSTGTQRGFGPADPALDLIVGWHLLDDERRADFRDALDPDDLDWERGRAWAFEQSIGLVWYYATSNPVLAEMGRRTLDRLVAEE